MAAVLRLLLVDDDDNKRLLLAHSLLERFSSAFLFQCRSGAEAIAYLSTRAVDAVVTDHSMTPVNGIELISWVRDRGLQIPVVMVTGHPEIEETALEAGATKVIPFARFTEIGDIVARLLIAWNPDGR